MSIRDFDQTKIVPLSRFRKPEADDPFDFVETYWRSLRTDNGVPLRSQINPQELRPVLSNVFILERIAPGLAKFRIAGSRMTALAGIEVRGMPITSFVRSPHRAVCSEAIETCLQNPAIVDIPILVRDLQHGPTLPGSIRLFPMTCDLGRVSRILGVLDVEGPIQSEAHRIDMTGFQVRDLEAEIPRHPAPLVECAEAPAPFRAPPRLELVYSAD